eukprot:6478815-Amphidinium_carterae.2
MDPPCPATPWSRAVLLPTLRQAMDLTAPIHSAAAPSRLMPLDTMNSSSRDRRDNLVRSYYWHRLQAARWRREKPSHRSMYGERCPWCMWPCNSCHGLPRP